jgi:hypothetical protein
VGALFIRGVYWQIRRCEPLLSGRRIVKCYLDLRPSIAVTVPVKDAQLADVKSSLLLPLIKRIHVTPSRWSGKGAMTCQRLAMAGTR